MIILSQDKEIIEFWKNNNKEYSFSFDIPKEEMLKLKETLGIKDDDFDFETYSIKIKALLNLLEKKDRIIETNRKLYNDLQKDFAC